MRLDERGPAGRCTEYRWGGGGGLKLAYLQQEKLVTSLSCLARLFYKQSRKERAATTLWGRQSRLLLMGTDCSEKLPPSR